MAYDLPPSASIQNGPAEQASKVAAERTTARSWRVLSEACRLAIIERALSPANDRVDGFRAAL